MQPLLAGPTFIGDRRVPLHPEDAARFRRQHNEALARDDNDRSMALAAELRRLDALAARKNAYDSAQRGGPVDQQLSYSLAAQDIGVPEIKPPGPSFESWATSEPESRNLLIHYASVPENFVYQATEALSDRKPASEIIDRLRVAVPGSLYPPAGYPVEPGRDRMYEELGPVAGLAAEMLMPGAGDFRMPATSAYRAIDRAFKLPIRTELIDANGDIIRRLRSAQ